MLIDVGVGPGQIGPYGPAKRVIRGGALLYRLDQVLREATGLAVVIAENPLQCVALGTGRALEERKRLSNVLTSMY